MPMREPGPQQTQRRYPSVFAATVLDPEQVFVFNFAEGRRGQRARSLIGHWMASRARRRNLDSAPKRRRALRQLTVPSVEANLDSLRPSQP